MYEGSPRGRPLKGGGGKVVFFAPDFFGFGEADVKGEEGVGGGELAGEGERVAESVNDFGAAGPEGAVEFNDRGVVLGEECGAMVVNAFA